MYFFNKLGKHVNCDERMEPFDFGCQSAKVKVMIGIIDKFGVHWMLRFAMSGFDFFIFSFN